MPIRLGASTPSRIYLGSNEIAAAYIGATQVWPEGPVYDPATMVLTMATTGASAEERTVRIPFNATGLNIDIDWGDGTVTNHVLVANPERVYANEGTYTILVTGAARRLGEDSPNTRWTTKLRSVLQWGALGLNNLTAAFRNYTGASLPLPSTLPTGMTSLSNTFRGCSNLTTPPDVSAWDTQNVTNMSFLWEGCSSLPSPPNVASWNTAKVQRMDSCFRNMGSFDIPCDDWSIAGVTTPNSFDNMFNATTLPTARYDALLTKWEAQAVKPVGAVFHGGSSKYTAAPSAAATARASLANPATNNWTMVDGGT